MPRRRLAESKVALEFRFALDVSFTTPLHSTISSLLFMHQHGQVGMLLWFWGPWMYMQPTVDNRRRVSSIRIIMITIRTFIVEHEEFQRGLIARVFLKHISESFV